MCLVLRALMPPRGDNRSLFVQYLQVWNDAADEVVDAVLAV